MARKATFSDFSGPLSTSVALFLLLLIAPVPVEVSRIVAALLLLGWTLSGLVWLVQRYGRLALVAVIAIGVSIAGAASYAYWQDQPNREMYSKIKSLRAFYVGTTGKIFTGEVDYVFFDSQASDEQVRQFTELDGLRKLDRLVIKGTTISDATAKRLSRFTSLRRLYLEGTQVTDETLDELHAALPHCSIEAR